MTLSLPTDPAGARSLTAVWTNLLAAIDGSREGWWTPARSAILVAVDGLGTANIAARAGHARFLSARSAKRDAARTVFPSTTAAALTTLMTGVLPGVHGVVGYRVRVPGTSDVVNQLTGWDEPGLLPDGWQRVQPVFDREAARGRPCFVAGPPEHVHSGLTRAILRGADYLPAETARDAVDIALDLASSHAGALVYVYLPELDRLGHKRGWESDDWAFGLESIDAAMAHLDRAAPADVGAVLTADHGMVDVPRHRHVLLSDGDDVLDGVAHLGGEPRMLHVYADADVDSDVLAARWRAQEGERSWVLSRDEAVTAGLFGPVDDAVLPRIGDVLVAARAGIAYYDDRLSDKRPQAMVGQHGSLTPAERIVPLVRLGAFA